MDFEALQQQRKSCRSFAPRPVPRDLLTRLVDTARLSPSACNSQPWHFIVVDEAEAKAKMVDALVDDGLTGCPWGNKVPAFILICEEKARLKPGVGERYGSQYFSQMDIGMAAMGLCYAATALGLGTCMIGVMSQEKMHRAFHIPEDRTARLAIAVGYPAQDVPTQRKDRKPLEEILGYNQW